MKLNIVYMGTPEFSVGPLRKLIKEYNVSLVVTQPDKKVGRKQEIKYSPVKEFALENSIEVFQPVNIREDYQPILDKEPDLIITCAYGQIIPKVILDYPKYKCINIHASLLPKYRGGAPIHHSIINGDEYTGVTIMYMDTKMDSGDILYQDKIKIEENDNVGTMFEKLSVLGSDMIMKSLPGIIDGTIRPIKQDEDKVTYAYNISKEDELLDFNKTSKEVFNKIRGLNPFPVSYALLDNKRVKIYSSRIGNSSKEGNIGEIINIYEDGIGVKTNDGEIIITELQFEGKKKTTVKDYLNGIQDKNKLLGKNFNIQE
ncbi:MAG: methionyl-tRNA formyltransferase [Bacilli bacterium]|nr:methionyl-tRNA formyltransferase [Bacilli bacterium]